MAEMLVGRCRLETARVAGCCRLAGAEGAAGHCRLAGFEGENCRLAGYQHRMERELLCPSVAT